MTTLANIQNKQLFTDLTPEESAVVEGGALFSANFKFDNYMTTRTFTNRHYRK